MLKIADKTFSSRLFTGTGKFASATIMQQAIAASGSELTTLALKRMDLSRRSDQLLAPLQQLGVQLLPNTAGARTANEAVYAAELARQALQTHWVKLEIHPDQRYLLPDPVETLKAAELLVNQGFVVLPYCPADPVLCKRLEEVGCAAVMPLGAPIGSNQGLQTREFLQIIVEQARVPVVVDAGIGAPSHAAAAMEIGVDAVLVNTAMATAHNPAAMAVAFNHAVRAGRQAFEAGLAAGHKMAVATSPVEAFLEDL
ncbi:MAG: thiazole synthase [Gammaproteobacteria bacterium]|nr:thiazole synthase [Gammaproteobacteria bacterium]